jgi:hypothetical protein
VTAAIRRSTRSHRGGSAGSRISHTSRTSPSSRCWSAPPTKLHNARSTLTDLRTHGAELWRRFNAGPSEQVWYYGTLADIFTRRFGGDARLEVLARELSSCVDEIERIISSDHQRGA